VPPRLSTVCGPPGRRLQQVFARFHARIPSRLAVTREVLPRFCSPVLRSVAFLPARHTPAKHGEGFSQHLERLGVWRPLQRRTFATRPQIVLANGADRPYVGLTSYPFRPLHVRERAHADWLGVCAAPSGSDVQQTLYL